MKLVKPDKKYKESYLKALEAIRHEDDRYHKIYLESKEDFDGAIKTLVQAEKDHVMGYDMFVTFLWLVEGSEFLGRLSIRHSLDDFMMDFGGHIGYIISPHYRRRGYGKKILELGLVEAKKLGLEDVLITCDEDNHASRKIIEACGGVFEDRRYDKRIDKDKLRYWIKL